MSSESDDGAKVIGDGAVTVCMQRLLGLPISSRFVAGRLVVALLAALAAGQAAAARVHVSVVDDRGAPVADAVVAIGADAPSRAPGGTQAIIDQQDRRFAPGVIAIQTGTEVSFPNSDDVRHHVYSFSRPNDFQIRLYHGEPSEPVRFDHSGIVSLGCNIHDGMVGFIAVVDTPWFQTTQANGQALIDGVQPGRHDLQLWHPDAGWSNTTVLVETNDQTVRRTLVITPGLAPPAAANPLQSLFDD